MISKYNVGLKTLLSEGLSEPEFYGDLVYKFKKLIGINDFSFQFRKIITRYRRIGYNLNVMRQSACLVFNPIMVDNYAAFFNCTPRMAVHNIKNVRKGGNYFLGKYKKVQVGKDQEKAQSEKDSHSKNRGGKKPN